MTNWTFPTNEQGWTLGGSVVWDGTVGNPAGSLHFPPNEPANDADMISLSIPVVDAPVSFDVRILITNISASDVTASVTLTGVGVTGGGLTILGGSYSVPYDSGWVHVTGTTGTGTVTRVDLSLSSDDATAVEGWFDNVYLDEVPVSDQLRLLGLAADSGQLYVTGIEDGELTAKRYDLENLQLQTSYAAGAAAYGDPDTLTKGIWPVVKPGIDQVLFLRGCDGNDVAVNFSDDGGATFSSKDDAGWGVAKFCIALLPDPLLLNDLVACFADNDLYRSEDGAATWSKTGDSPVTLGEAARHISTPAELMLAAQAANSLRFTNNYGASFEDVSETMGTVRAIEVSR